MFKLSFKILTIVLFFILAANAQAYYRLAQPTGFVSDFAHIFNSEQQASLEKKLVQFKQQTGTEIAVVTVDSLKGDTIDNFAVKLFSAWGIGQKGRDNGILLLIAVNNRKMRIEVGYGLEGALTDIQSHQIITNVLRPAFQGGQYYQGVDLALNQIMAATQGEYKPVKKQAPTSNRWRYNNIGWLLFSGFYLLLALKRYLAKSRSWWQGGVIGLVIGALISVIFFSTLYLLTFVASFAVFGLVFDFLVSRFKIFANKPGGRNNSFWFFGGPRGGSGGSSGGGFGGFGGGFSGGGGASGGW